MTIQIKSTVSKFLADVAEQRLGYRFADPERVTPEALAVVIPILRETTLQRQYVLLSEAKDDVVITDTGKINRMRLYNQGRHNVFVRSGTIFRGGTQERALTRSAVLFHGQTAELDVRCVHQSKGIKSGAKVEAGGYTPLSVDKQVYGAGYQPKGQGDYWHSVTKYAQETQILRGAAGAPAPSAPPVLQRRHHHGDQRTRYNNTPCLGTTRPPAALHQPPPTPYDLSQIAWNQSDLSSDNQSALYDTVGAAENLRQGHQTKQDDLATTIDSVASNLDAILSKVRRHDNQVGLGLITECGLQCVELFDLDASWSAIHQDAVKRVGSDLARQDKQQVFDYKPRAAMNTLAAVLADQYQVNQIFEHKPANGEPLVRIYGLTSDRYVGEVVEIDSRIMHVSIIRTAA